MIIVRRCHIYRRLDIRTRRMLRSDCAAMRHAAIRNNVLQHSTPCCTSFDRTERSYAGHDAYNFRPWLATLACDSRDACKSNPMACACAVSPAATHYTSVHFNM